MSLNVGAQSAGIFNGDSLLLLWDAVWVFFLGQRRTSVFFYCLFSVSRFNCCSPNIFIMSLLLVEVGRVLTSVWFGAVQNGLFSVGSTAA